MISKQFTTVSFITWTKIQQKYITGRNTDTESSERILNQYAQDSYWKGNFNLGIHLFLSALLSSQAGLLLLLFLPNRQEKNSYLL